MSSLNEPNGALESWKEIADFLGVNPRTAQKWEKERALPVQRFGGKRGRVATTREELTEWRRQNLNGASWWSNVGVLRGYSLAVSALLAIAAMWILVEANFGRSALHFPADNAGGGVNAEERYPALGDLDRIKRVRVGLLPDRVVVSRDGSRAYVADGGSGRVSLVNTTTVPPSVIATVSVGSGPQGLAVSPDGSLVYVPNNGDGTVSVIESAGHRVIATVPAGYRPRVAAFSPDGSKAYVTSRGGTLSVFDTSNHEKLADLDVGGQPHGIVLTSDGTRAYVAQRSHGTVAVIDLAKAFPAVAAQIAVGEFPHLLAKTADGSKIYVSNLLSDSVSVIDAAANTVSATITVGDAPHWLAVTPDGRRLYVANSFSNTISIIDTQSDRVVGTVETVVDGPRGLAFAPLPPRAGSSNEFMLLGTGGSSTLYATAF